MIMVKRLGTFHSQLHTYYQYSPKTSRCLGPFLDLWTKGSSICSLWPFLLPQGSSAFVFSELRINKQNSVKIKFSQRNFQIATVYNTFKLRDAVAFHIGKYKVKREDQLFTHTINSSATFCNLCKFKSVSALENSNNWCSTLNRF